MPEIKNTFLKGKMNKDLDARLIPNGEYADAQNIHIAKSDGTDVGVVQNVKGNSKIGNIDISGKVIGYLDESESLSNGSNRVFYFLSAGGVNDNIYYHNTEDTTSPIPIINNTSNFLNFSDSNLITGVNIIDDLLFWTDNNNQPRKINVKKALENNSYYNTEAKISVAKYYPYNAPLVLNPTEDTQTGLQKLTTTNDVNGAVSSSSTVTLQNSNYNIYVNQLITGTGVSNDTLVVSFNTTSKVLITSKPVTVADGATLTFTNKEDRIEEEFIKFAYRYKFEDGEYSVISPFTQTCFIPKTYNASSGLSTAQISDAATTTELESMINDVGRVQLRINLPSSTVTTDYGINKIEILYKEADNPGIKAIAELSLTDNDITTASYAVSGNLLTYNYELNLPFKTLPEDQLTRVFDNVPRKAKAQEIAGSRIMYGNFQENYDLPSVDFEAGYVTRQATASDQNWNVQYPYQSVKARRTYQIGLILADKYGRQSPVILPSDANKSSVRVPVHTGDPGSWNGYSLKIEFNETISNPYSATNEFGWYSWKVVVKQTEQEYNNVYAPAVKDNFPHGPNQTGTLNTTATIILDGSASTVYTDDDKRSWLVLHGDNVNKVPKEAGAGGVILDKTSGSDAALYPVVTNAFLTPTGTLSDPFIYNLDGPKIDVTSIGTAKEQGLANSATRSQADGTVDLIYEPGEVIAFIYNSNNNPLVAELPNGNGFIRLDDGATNFGLSVFETEPFKSALDIYYETSLTGLVEDLNTEILGNTGGPAGLTITSSSFSEGDNANTIIGTLGATNSLGSAMSGLTFQLNSVFAQSDLNTDLANNFDINGGNLRITNTIFYYGVTGESYNVSITATDGNGEDLTENLVITLNNAAPVFSSSLSATANSLHYSAGATILDAGNGTENGSKDTTRNNLGLVYSIEEVTLSGADVTSSNLFEITNTGDSGNPSPGLLKSSGYMAQSLLGNVYNVKIKVVDAGHTISTPSSDEHTVSVTIIPKTLIDQSVSSSAPGLCQPSTQTLYITKPQLGGPNTIEVGDTIYTNSNLSTTFYGLILTQPIGGQYDQGKYADVENSNGVVQSIDNSRSCQETP